MSENVQEKINMLSMIEQNVQQISNQRQSFQTQLLETESAINELSSSNISYRIIGNIMVKVDAEKLKKELEEKHKILETRISSIEKQEKTLKEKAKKIQEEVISGLEKTEKSKNSGG